MKKIIINLLKKLQDEVKYYLEMLDNVYKSDNESEFKKDCYFKQLIELYKKIRVLKNLKDEMEDLK